MTPDGLFYQKNFHDRITNTPKGKYSNQSLSIACQPDSIFDQNCTFNKNMIAPNIVNSLLHSEVSLNNWGSGQYKLHNKSDKNLSCQCCGKRFTKKKRLEIHIRSHTGLKPHKCTYPNCGKSFNEKGNLKTHMRIHTGEKPYKCNVSTCGKQFTTCGHLKDHMRQHTGERPYFCNICGENFVRSSTLRIHIRIHTGEKPYPCFLCPKKFSECGNLNTHLKIIHKFVKSSIHKRKKLFKIEKAYQEKEHFEVGNEKPTKPSKINSSNNRNFSNTILQGPQINFKLPSLIDNCLNPNPCLCLCTDKTNSKSSFTTAMRSAINLNRSLIQNQIPKQIGSFIPSNQLLFFSNYAKQCEQ